MTDNKPYINFHDGTELEDFEVDFGYGVLDQALQDIMNYAEINKCGFYKAIQDLHPGLDPESVSGIMELVNDKVSEMFANTLIH